jgi:hypothetical protein
VTVHFVGRHFAMCVFQVGELLQFTMKKIKLNLQIDVKSIFSTRTYLVAFTTLLIIILIPKQLFVSWVSFLFL